LGADVFVVLAKLLWLAICPMAARQESAKASNEGVLLLSKPMRLHTHSAPEQGLSKVE